MEMDKELLEYILPEGILNYFQLRKVEEVEDKNTLTRKSLHIYLEEKNELRAYPASEYECKDFCEPKMIADFPIRGKSVYLLITRRRWRHKENKNLTVQNNYDNFANNTKMTKELSNFLKSTTNNALRYYFHGGKIP